MVGKGNIELKWSIYRVLVYIQEKNQRELIEMIIYVHAWNNASL